MKIYQIFVLTLGFASGFVHFVQAQNPIAVSIPNVSEEKDSTVIIPIDVGDLTGSNVFSYQAVINFDELVLDAIGASSTQTLTESFGQPAINTSVDSQITVGGFGTSALSDSGTLVNLIFKVVGQPAEMTNLDFPSFIFNSGDPSATTPRGDFSG